MRLRAPLLLLPLAAAAQTAPDSTLDAVTVTAAREPVATAAAPARVTVLDADALEATAAASLADALEARAPVHVRRYGPTGLATATVRGATSAQTLVLLDGLPVTDPQLGQVDLSLLPTALVESVEVLSGPAAGLYGSAGVGGVVHLRSPRAEGTAARASTTVGPWGERRASGLGSVRAGGLRAVAAVEAAQADNDFSVVDEALLEAPRVAREGWDSQQTSAYAAVGHEAGARHVGVSLWAADAERGLGGAGGVDERQWDRRIRLGATAGLEAAGTRFEAAGAVQRARLRYANPYPSDRPDRIDDTGRTTAAHLDLRASRPLGAWTATAALAAGAGRGEHPSLDADATDRFAGLALGGRGPLGTVTLFPTLRADVYAPSGLEARVAWSPQLGANVALAGGWRLKAGAARSFRMPTLNDRFWQPGGNPDLRPETALSADAGVVWASTAAHVEATAFAATARDQIVWLPTAAGFYAPQNVARTRSLGLEASMRAARAVRLAGRSALVEAGAVGTLTDARDTDTDRPLRYVPRWTAKGWAAVAAGAVRLDLGARAVGVRYSTASASQPVDGYLVVDAQVSVRPRLAGARLVVALAAENLTDARYEVVRSYPMPPRHARLRLSLTL